MRSSFGRFGMLKKQEFQRQHFVPELLGRREIGLPSAGAKTNELIAEQSWYVKKKQQTNILGKALCA